VVSALFMILFQEKILGSKDEGTEKIVLMIAIPVFLLLMSLSI
jgi:hypothetical protein